jgi:hypothetical protein
MPLTLIPPSSTAALVKTVCLQACTSSVDAFCDALIRRDVSLVFGGVQPRVARVPNVASVFQERTTK